MKNTIFPEHPVDEVTSGGRAAREGVSDLCPPTKQATNRGVTRLEMEGEDHPFMKSFSIE